MFTWRTVTVLVVSIFISFSQIKAERESKIKWTIKKSPIVFGDDAVLFCNLSATDNCCTNTVTWMKESAVILHHGASTNNSKYQEINENNGFSIIIKHFDEKDINCQYTCLYEFYTYSRVLDINTQDFELQPTKETIESTIFASSSQLLVVLNFSKVFPSPQCQILINKRVHPSKRFVNETRSGLFVSSHVKLMCDMPSDICSRNISVQCFVGRTDMQIEAKRNISDCKESDTPAKTRIYTTEVASTVTVVIAILTVALVTIFWRRKGNAKSHCCRNAEDQYLQDERIPLLCITEIINETSTNFCSIPVQKSKDVKLFLQTVCLFSKYLRLTYTNNRINENRVESSTEIATKNNCQQMSNIEEDHVYHFGGCLYFKKDKDLVQMINFAKKDVKNMLLTATNNRINEKKLLTWLQQTNNYIQSTILTWMDAICTLFYTSNSKIDDEMKQKRNKDDTVWVSDRITNSKDLSQAIANFKQTNSNYCQLMASNMRINNARGLMS